MMKKPYVGIVILLAFIIGFGVSYRMFHKETLDDNNDDNQEYVNSAYHFSISLPQTTSSIKFNDTTYIIDEGFKHAVSPEKTISGVRFTIPTSFAQGTNLSKDSYISFEEVPFDQHCDARLFADSVPAQQDLKTIIDNETTYSVFSSTDAAAGNRYEQTIYAFSQHNRCVAIRYFIHSTVYENYDPTTIKKFNREQLLNQFDQIRRTLELR